MKFGNKALKISAYAAALVVPVVLEVLYCGNYIDPGRFVFMAAVLLCQFFVLRGIAGLLF